VNKQTLTPSCTCSSAIFQTDYWTWNYDWTS